MIKFGTGGFRAIIGDGFIKENIVKISLALVKIIDTDELAREVIIGYDRRFLSKEGALWMTKVLTDAGVKVWFIDKSTPTPMIMFGVMSENVDIGIAITASHNPALYNGIKLFQRGGVDAGIEFTNRVEAYANDLDAYDFDATDFSSIVSSPYFEFFDNYNAYINSILSQIDVEKIQGSRIKVGVDPLYGVSEKALQTLLNTARCNVFVINEMHDTLFGGKLPAPTIETVSQLQTFVVQNQLDIGVATDGDADRIGIVDDKGNFLHPNDVLMMIYYYQLAYQGKTGAIVRNISTTHTLDKIAKAFGQDVYEVPVGFKNISQKMIEVDALLGGESSGGLTIRGHIKGKDGIYAAMVLVEMIAVTGKSILSFYKEVLKRFGETQTVELQYRTSDIRKLEILKILDEAKFVSLPGFEKQYLPGGIKFVSDDRWILVRFSGTEPLLRIVSELAVDENVDPQLKIIEDFLKLNGGNNDEVNS